MRTTPLALLATTAVLVVAGCGSDSDSGSSSGSSGASTPTPAAASGGGGQDLEIDATEMTNSLGFSMKTLQAKAGKVTITMANPSGNKTAHAVAIEGNGVDADGKVVQPGGTSTVTATLKAGTYTYYCPVPGHEDAGMKGTLTVQ